MIVIGLAQTPPIEAAVVHPDAEAVCNCGAGLPVENGLLNTIELKLGAESEVALLDPAISLLVSVVA